MAPVSGSGSECGRGRGLFRPPLRFHKAQSELDSFTMAMPQRTQSKQPRDPPPSLFLHPSPAASHVSLPGILAPGAPVPGPAMLTRERSHLDVSGATLSPNKNRTMKSTASIRSTDRTDALWAEMQATLEEVELSASGGTHVFGKQHDNRLADLRNAQIALAQAWARSEADDAIETAYRDNVTSATGDELGNIKAALGDVSKPGAAEVTDVAKSTAPSDSVRPEGSAEVEKLGAKLEEETEADILLARKRREANDQYFQRVNNGVIDVVAKLEEVAVAMRAVEQESKDVWNESDTGSVKSQ